MKKGFKRSLASVMAGLGIVALAACGQKETKTYKVTFDADGGSSVAVAEVAEGSKVDSAFTQKAGKKFDGWYTADDQKFDFESAISGDLTLKAKWVDKEYIDETKADAQVSAVEGTRYSYANRSYAEKQIILGLLEKYAVNNGLTGLTIYGDGSYVKYHSSVVKGSNEYINGYGFGIISEGSLKSDLEGESNPDYKRYYHTFETDVPATMNYMNDKGSVVGSLYGYISSSYFGTRMNSKKNGFEWYSLLSKEEDDERLFAVNPDADGLATQYKFRVRTGEDGFKYATLSSKLSQFDGRDVEKDDYLTPFKLLHSQANGFERAGDNFGSSSAIKGDQAFYNATKDATTWEQIDAAWASTMGQNVYFDEDGYLNVTLASPQNKFYAMYYITSSLYTPIPKDFIDAIGGAANYGNETNSGLNPVDTTLSTGPYVLESWSDQAIVFKKNTRTASVLYEGRYNIAGIHVAILTGAKTDQEAAWKEFHAQGGAKLHAVSVPSTQLDAHKNDEGVTMTSDDSTYKINMNVCDEATWVALFGKNGTITKTAEADYWTLKPAMSNKDFTNGLSYALDRETFAATYGRTPTANFFGNSYLSNPEDGVIYNDTVEHKAAVADLINAYTDEYGYSFALAQDSFTKAAKTLTEAGKYRSGDTVKIEIAWQTEAQKKTQGATLKSMFEKAFNESGANTQYGLTLEVENVAVATWTDVYYKKMMVGQFDLAFGSISGNSLNPLNFLEVLKSDNSSGFTLNWGTDTNAPSDSLVYDGKTWSFDALWQAADSAVCADSTGKRINFFNLALSSSKHEADGKRVIKFKYSAFDGADSKCELVPDIVFYYLDNTGATKKAQLEEGEDFTATVVNGEYIISISADIEAVAEGYDLDFYYNVVSKVEADKILNEENYEIGHDFSIEAVYR